MFIDGMLHPFLQALICYWILSFAWKIARHPLVTMLPRMRWRIIQELYEEDCRMRAEGEDSLIGYKDDEVEDDYNE